MNELVASLHFNHSLDNLTIPSSQIPGFENLIEGLIQNELGHETNFFTEELNSKLRAQLLFHYENGEMHKAGIGKKFTFHQNAEVRGDVIKWIANDSEIEAEREFIEIIQNFICHLNSTCYTGINDFEFHYALYDVGSFYKPHIDRFHHDSGRKFSFVTYLNEDWKSENGGEFVAYLGKEIKVIYPYSRSVCFFPSDKIEHEVKEANRQRMSIAGWLKRV